MQKKKFHYGWIILIASLLVFLINGGLTSTAFSVYLPHMIENGGYTNTQITLINTIRAVTALLTTLVTVTLINKLKPRMVVLIMCVSTAIAYFLFAFAQSLWVYYVAAVFLGIPNGGGTMVLCSIILRRWFKKGIGTAIGICGAGSAIAGTIVPPLVTSGVATIGLSKTFMIEGVIIIGMTVIAVLLMRNAPEDMGIRPVGDGEQADAAKKKGGAGFLPKKEIFIVTIAAFLVGSVNGFVSVNSLLIKGTGFDATQTAYFLSIFGTVMFVGKLVYGALHDSIGGLITNFIFTTAYVVGLFIIWLWIPSTGLMVAAIVMVALGCCLCASGLPCWAADLLPADQYDKAIGRNQAAYNLCALLFSIVPGPIADLTGSYRMVALILTVMAAIIFVIINRGYIINVRLAKAAAAESN